MDKHFRLKDLSTGDIVTLPQSSITIGRGPYNHLQVKSKMVSSQHASIDIKGLLAVIEDLNSTNGTQVNGMRIKAPTELIHGDVISVGDCKYMLISPEKNDASTVFSLNMGGGRVLPDSKLSQLNAGTLSHEESKFVSAKIVEHVIFKANKSYLEDTALLIILGKSSISQSFELGLKNGGSNCWFIGRDDRCTVTIDNPTVSVDHATLSCSDGVWIIKDNGSTNGTKVNGVRVVESECKNGDLISLGKLNCVFGIAEAVVEAVE